MFKVFIIGTIHCVFVSAETKWQAIERALFEKGMSSLEVDRRKYKAIKL